MRLPRPSILALALALALAGRLVLALRPGLWGDEIFSLAMATGHSLEHPAAAADPSQGDFVEPPGVVSSDIFRRYAVHDSPPEGPGRVLRAVLLSDTSPPLYYLLLHGWTRAFGTGDAAVRLFSLLFATLAAPVIWAIGNAVGGRRMAWTATLLYALSPVSVFYSLEARMYSLLWLLAAVLAWLSLQLQRRGATAARVAGWALVASAGLLTHYFFLFVWAAILAWLLAQPGKLHRGRVPLLAGLTIVAVAPWYVQVPASLARWRLSGQWLATPLQWPGAATRPFELAWSLLAGGSFWGGSPAIDIVLAFAYLLLAVWIARRGALRNVFTPDSLLLWLWVAGAVFGPVVFDLARGTSASMVPRYVLAALPAAMLLAALGLERLTARAHTAFLAFVLLAWTAGLWPIVSRRARSGAAYPALATELGAWAGPTDLVLVHSIPSGLIGLSRYLARPVPMGSWIEPLGLRAGPADLEALLRGRRRVALVQVHNIGRAARAETWLRSAATLVREEVYDARTDTLTAKLGRLSADQRTALAQHQLIEIFYFSPRLTTEFAGGASER